MNKIRINVKSLANVAAARRDTRNGRDVVIVPSATLPDDVVMNGIKYPADVIAASYHSLEKTPAPLGHPMIDGAYVSALDPEAINENYIGAWNENVQRRDGRVFMDKVIDVSVAESTDGGRKTLMAIERGDPIHTSTGLWADLADSDEDGVDSVATAIMFDHDAILLNESGAATPDQGVGMFVNSDGEKLETQVINSALDSADAELDWAVEALERALVKRKKAPALERMKQAILELFGVADNSQNGDQHMSNDQLKELEARVNSLSEKLEAVNEAIAGVGDTVKKAMEPVLNHFTSAKEAQEAQEAAEKAALVNKVVESNILTEEAAKGLTLNALKELADSKSVKAAVVNADESDDEFAGYDMNDAIKEGE